MQDKTEPFPLEWNAWREQWAAWLAEQREAGTLRPTSFRFPGKNFLADEVLGTWSVNGRNVELSEVTFPALGERPRRDVRYVGVTYGTGADADGAVVPTFAELERELGITADAGPVSALETCNACDAEPMHDRCEAGYCPDCCPAHGEVAP